MKTSRTQVHLAPTAVTLSADRVSRPQCGNLVSYTGPGYL